MKPFWTPKHPARMLPVICLALALLLLPAPPADGCSSFTLQRDGALLVGRNLDATGPTPGTVFVNPRGLHKTSATFGWLYGGRRYEGPALDWVSRYGSVTFNAFGAELPDGGMNEAGLCFEEMTLLETVYSAGGDRPTIFMIQWIQYVLDNFATVAEVLQHVPDVAIDGWNWHFYVADRQGDSAVIEFLDGVAKIRHGQNLPYPLLCNSTYDKELEGLAGYSGHGGEEPIDLESDETPRFVRGVAMFERFAGISADSAVDFGFELLDVIAPGGDYTNWAKLYDLKERRVHFHTDVSRQLKYLDLDDLDFDCSAPRLFFDIHADIAGDIRPQLRRYSAEANRHLVAAMIEIFSREEEVAEFITGAGTTPAEIIERLADLPASFHCD